MKRRKITSAIIMAVIATIYLFVYLFVLRQLEHHVLFLVILIASGVIATYLLGATVVDQALLNEALKLRDEITSNKSLINSLESNNEIVTGSLPIGIICFNENYFVTYANEACKNIFNTNIAERKIELISKEILDSLKESLESFVVKIYNKNYLAHVKYDSSVIYLTDITEQESANKQLVENETSLIYVNIDNADEELSNLTISKRSEIEAKFYQAISEWARKYHTFGFSEDSDTQKLIVKEKDLQSMIKDQFSVVESINSISKVEGLLITLSIGVGTKASDYVELGYYADKALENAKTRGGAQAVIYDGKTFTSFGSNVFSNEKLPKTMTKIYYKKLVDRIKNSSSVLVLPHIDTDADALGASLGIVEICNLFNTPAKVVLNLDRIDSTVKKIINASKSEFIKLSSYIISTVDVQNFFKGDTTLIVVDHHKTELSCFKKPYKMANYVSIIDHHRVTESIDFIHNTEYIDHVASSSVELVMNLYSFIDKKIELPPFIATTMLCGMMVDSTNFTAHVNEDSFKAASMLASFGSDSLKAKMLLREPLDEQIERLRLLEKAEIFNGKFAILKLDNKIVHKDFLAKIAEDLLNIEEVKATFVVGMIDGNTVGVSSRSDQTFNVHREMERLGGGGHFAKGAAQLKNRTINDVAEEIIINVKQTVEGDSETMKVILICDVKKQGKKGDIIECTPGYANFLMSKKFAVEANASNMAVLEEQKSATQKLEKEELDVALKTKTLLESKTIDVFVKIGENGKFFGSISPLSVSEAIKNQLNIDVDKRKISLVDKIDSLGTYKCFVKLHREVTANITINVKEGKE